MTIMTEYSEQELYDDNEREDAEEEARIDETEAIQNITFKKLQRISEPKLRLK